jgi:myo-inositol-1(or 4)-monophosphatase
MGTKYASWGRILKDATERAQVSVSAVALGKDRGQSVGIGASGDKTLLADKEAEDVLIGALLKIKGLRVLSEEAGRRGDSRAKLLAVIDPLDGSSNFERGIPFYCTSVAIAEGSSLKDVTFAMVRDLVTGDVYSATEGGGAKKNGRNIRTSNTTSLSESVVGIDLNRTTLRITRGLSPLVTSARNVHYGANALELCYVAEGRLDAMVDVRGLMRVTDFAGAYLICKEAGATVTSSDGESLDVPLDLATRFSYVVSANLSVHERILSRLSEL